MLTVGTMLRGGAYRIEKQLASGGFGNTYMVKNVAFNELYALKEFFMRGVNMRNGNNVTVSVPDNHASYESQKEKFRKEAIRLRNLNNPHIVKVHDLFEENGTSYYVMDYIDGESIAERIKNSGKAISEEQTWHILPQVLDALSEVHAQGIWHLDIKPGNIMLDSRGNAFLIDFGASKQLTSSGSQTSSALCYTPGYAPVEQVEQAMDKFGPWTDFYALGATLYYMQTLQQPPSSTALTEGDAFNFPPEMSQPMSDLIVWMMQPTRKKRPQSVDDIKKRIAPVVGGSVGGNVGGSVGGSVGGRPLGTSDDTLSHGRKDASGQGAVVNDGATSLANSEDDERKAGGGLWKVLLTLVVLAGLGAGAYFMFFSKSEEEKAAEAAQEEYEEKVDKCRHALNEASNFPELEDARTMFRPIKKLEEQHAEAMPEVFDKLDELEKLYAKRVKKQKEEYLQLVSDLTERGDYRTAYDLCKEAAEALTDDDEMNDKLDELAIQMGYVYVTDANFANRLNSENIEEPSKRLKAADMRYLTPILTYNSLLPSGHSAVVEDFTYSIIDEDGVLDHSNSSPAGYTNDSSFEVLYGEHDQGVWLSGWGNATQSFYEEGEYTFEFYYKGHKLYTTKFTLY